MTRARTPSAATMRGALTIALVVSLIASAAEAKVPLHLAKLFGPEVSTESARRSAACERTEDVHICGQDALVGAAAELPNACYVPRCDTEPQFNNGGGTRPVGLPFAGRSPVHAQHAMAATSVPLSTMCAIDILKAGGSAVDGAIAANLCENVVEPMMNGMGGDCMAQVLLR